MTVGTRNPPGNMIYTSLLSCLFTFYSIQVILSLEEDLEIVLLPTEWDGRNATVPLRFTAFGEKINLRLEKNYNLLTSNLEIWKREDGASKRVDDTIKVSPCHYLHQDLIMSAAVSLCDFGKVYGLILLENDSLEITPLGDEDELKLMKNHEIKVRSTSYGEPHVVKRRKIPSYFESRAFDARSFETLNRSGKSSAHNNVGDEVIEELPLTIELGLFFDATAYGLLKPLLGDDSRLVDMLLAYVNNVQALYYHPSLGRRIELALVRLELMERQPEQLAQLDGERLELLEAFCAYSASVNPPDDSEPGHWDLGLYLSGLDFYALEDGKRNPVTMGLAPVGGVCRREFACVITEIAVSNELGRPYPSAGFNSVFIAAHEIGHNLGMHHDSKGNECPRDGFIMSPSRGTRGEAQWSRCSRALAAGLGRAKPCLLGRGPDPQDEEQRRRLDHGSRFEQLPGRHWGAKRQCELLLREPDAFADSLDDCCQALRCRSPSRDRIFLAGPALDGTECRVDAECRAGECLPRREHWDAVPTVAAPPSAGATGWSTWSEGSCESGCLRGSLGFSERRRTCLGDSDSSDCPGLSFDVRLCKDEVACGERKRISALEFAGRRCAELAERLEEIDGRAGGLQAEHEPRRPWVACALFCRRSDNASFYAPRLEMHRLGLDPYLPDGTWCHVDPLSGENYFCRRHHCLPETFRFGKGLMQPGADDELVRYVNPDPDWQAHLQRYFSLHLDGRPMLSTLRPTDDDPQRLPPRAPPAHDVQAEQGSRAVAARFFARSSSR